MNALDTNVSEFTGSMANTYLPIPCGKVCGKQPMDITWLVTAYRHWRLFCLASNYELVSIPQIASAPEKHWTMGAQLSDYLNVLQ